MRINNNLMSMNAHRQLGINNKTKSASLEKLSSGLRINRAADDAAGLAISEKMRGQVRGLQQASRNSQDGISMIQTAEGALNETHAILQRMRELAVQGQNDTNVAGDRAAIAAEITQLANEVERISTETEFNTQKLLNGSAVAIQFQVGANSGQVVQLSINDMTKTALGLESVENHVGNPLASLTIGAVNTAIITVSTERANLGAIQNRLEHSIKNSDNTAENLQAAESRIRDVDMAKEMTAFTKTNILAQAAQSMLGQANQAPQGILQLLQ